MGAILSGGSVAILSISFAGGGAERSSLLTASHWPNSSEVVFVTCLNEGPYALTVPAQLVTDEIGVMPSPLRLVGFARRLDSIVARHNIRVIFLNGYGLNQMVLLSQALRLLRRTRIVVVEH